MPAPPAPNRERVERFTWNRDYFHAPTRLSRYRAQLTLLALILALGWLALGWAMPDDRREFRYTHGPVSNPHAAWDMRCDACHQPSSVADLSVGSLLDVHARWHAFRCETCHHGSEKIPKDYAPHHVNGVWPSGGSNSACGLCHRDHQGREHSLVKLPDRDCTQCHRDLNEHVTGTTDFALNVRNFAESHPEFKVVKENTESPYKDKRTLLFNHSLHMKPGIGAPKDYWDKLKFRDRYQFNQDGAVTLECASCHQLDAGRDAKPGDKTWDATKDLVRNLPRDSVLPPRAPGAYYLPINYELHCQACHPIATGPLLSPDLGEGARSIELPHRLQGEELNKAIRDRIAGQISESKTATAKTPPKDMVDPKTRGRLDPVVEQLRELQKSGAIQDLQEKALSGITCNKCHYYQSTTEKNSIKVMPVSTPAIWFTHAKFNHAPHRAMTCVSCHPGKDKSVLEKESSTREPLDIPGIANCRQCHAPTKRVTIDGKTETQGGVRYGCVDCHQYHNGERPLHGPGSPLRDPPADNRLDINAFLRGSRKGNP